MITEINQIKRRHHGQPGGSFLVNEYGDVIVPTRWGKRFCVGKMSGSLRFISSDNGRLVDLSDDSNLDLGDPWELPYVGMVYHLSARGRLYYWDKGENKSQSPRVQDKDLIKRIRTIRRSGPVKILVNPYGIVLTKVPIDDFDFDEDKWKPVYIGRLDYSKWFAEEALECQTSS